MEIFDFVGHMPLFKGIEQKEVDELFSIIHFKLQKHDKEQAIANEGDRLNDVKLLVVGSVRTEIWKGEKVTQVAKLDAPKLLAPSFIFGNQNSYPVNVVSNTNVELIQIENVEFQKMLHSNQQLMVNFLDIISSRTQFLAKRIQLLSLRTIKQKLAKYLLELASDELRNFNLPMTQAKLADYFAVARPPLTKAFAELSKERIIRIDGRSIYILDKAALQQILQQ
ncbi:MAG: Crp/Fnr family transcriptional regulator [Mangrovibacterium sp.]